MSRDKEAQTKDRSRPTRALRSPPFRKLDRQARWVQRFLILLVCGIALVPGTVVFILEWEHLKNNTYAYAVDCAVLVGLEVIERGVDLDRLAMQLRVEMEVHDIIYARLLGPDSQEVLRLGDPAESALPTTERVPLPKSAAPLQEIEIQIDASPLLPRMARVFGIHFIVATILWLAIYRLPIRALHRAIDELETAHDQLMHSDKLSSIGEMYAGLTHEINNPLSIILTRVKLRLSAPRDKRIPPQMVKDLEMIERHGTRIADIIRSLLAFARKAPFQTTETDVNRVIQDVVTMVEQPFAKQGIQVRAHLSPALAPVEASPDHLQQVFLNLVNNARDAMPSGGTITLRTEMNKDHLVAEVQDTGTGIATDVQEKLFEPFFTTKGARKGTGLGLSVSYGIVSAHGGKLEVDSTLGEGALFRLTLPREGGQT